MKEQDFLRDDENSHGMCHHPATRELNLRRLNTAEVVAYDGSILFKALVD